MKKKKEKVARVAISIPPKLLQEFNHTIKRMGYKNKSEAFRDAARYFMEKHQPIDDHTTTVGVISILYDHNITGISDLLTDFQHHHQGLIQSSIHLHLDQNNCIEFIVVKGKTSELTELKNRITALRGVKKTEASLTPIK